MHGTICSCRRQKRHLNFFSLLARLLRLFSRWIDFSQWIIKRQYALSFWRFYKQWLWSMWSLFSDGVFAFLFCAPLFSFEIAQTLWNIFCIHFCFRSICELIIVDSIILSLRGEKKSDGIEQTNAEGERERRKEVGDTEEQEQRERERVCVRNWRMENLPAPIR